MLHVTDTNIHLEHRPPRPPLGDAPALQTGKRKLVWCAFGSRAVFFDTGGAHSQEMLRREVVSKFVHMQLLSPDEPPNELLSP